MYTQALYLVHTGITESKSSPKKRKKLAAPVVPPPPSKAELDAIRIETLRSTDVSTKRSPVFHMWVTIVAVRLGHT
jgi:hypothetical protein